MCNRALLASDVIDFAMLPTQSILVWKRFVYRCHVTSNWPMKVHGMIFCIVPCNFYQGTSICYHHKLRSPCVKMNTPTMNICLRVLDPEDKRKSWFFQLRDVPCFLVWTAYCLRLYFASHKKFRNMALNCSFRNAQEKWSLCNWMLKNMDKRNNLLSKVFTKWSWHRWLA